MVEIKLHCAMCDKSKDLGNKDYAAPINLTEIITAAKYGNTTANISTCIARSGAPNDLHPHYPARRRAGEGSSDLGGRSRASCERSAENSIICGRPATRSPRSNMSCRMTTAA